MYVSSQVFAKKAGCQFRVPVHTGGNVRADNHVWHIPQLTLLRQGLDFKHIQSRTCDLFVLQRLYPVDKVRNADGYRRPIETQPQPEAHPNSGIAPLLRQMMSDYAATGLPPAYIPRDITIDDNSHEETDT